MGLAALRWYPICLQGGNVASRRLPWPDDRPRRHRLLRLLARESTGRRPGGNPGVARGLRRTGGNRRPRARHLPAAQAARPRARAPRAAAAGAEHAVQEFGRARRAVAVPGQPRSWRAASRPSCAGTRSPWWCAPTARIRSSAATSPAMPRPRICSKSASTISSAPTTWCISSRIRRPGVYARAFLEGRLSEENLANYRRETGRQRAVVVLPSVSDAGVLAVSRPARWAWGRSTRSIRRASCAISSTEAS